MFCTAPHLFHHFHTAFVSFLEKLGFAVVQAQFFLLLLSVIPMNQPSPCRGIGSAAFLKGIFQIRSYHSF
jgi:hypothetical protein